ncbi:amino acid ABC transporter permease [Candidatus Izemoplasma sp. B36]|uniref:amino acid ABC transporter permease n=1 Tax=Candidatus Izemoplasma sp. B36 TaxID=3242468 RepID=UPI003556EE38
MNSTSTNKFNNVIWYSLAILTVLGFVIFVVLRQTTDFSFIVYKDYSSLIQTGIINTILISVISLLGSMILGFVFYLLSKSKIKYFNALIDVFTEIIYGTPLLVLIIVMAFLIGPAFNTYERNVMGTIALIIYMSPYMKNVYKSAFSSISEEQYMAMDLFGFTPFQRYRYIIIPQVIRILMPPMMNNFSLIIKGSALLNVLSYTELFYAIRLAQSKTFAFVEGYILMWMLYLIITIPLSQLTKLVERKWSL